MKSLVPATVSRRRGSTAAGRPSARLQGLVPAAFLLSGCFMVWAGPMVSSVAAAGAKSQVAAWGEDQFHQAEVPAGLSDVVAIAVGNYFNLALKASGQVVAWGDDNYHETEVPTAAQSGVVAISAGGDNAVALKAD